MMVVAIMGLISIPVTLGLPLPTARSTSTPPPGPMMAYSPCGRSTLATDGAADIRLFFQLKLDCAGNPVRVGVALGLLSRSHNAGSVFIRALVASASITMYRPLGVSTSMREIAFHLANSTHLGSRKTPLA